jgi:hypothetical protein
VHDQACSAEGVHPVRVLVLSPTCSALNPPRTRGKRARPHGKIRGLVSQSDDWSISSKTGWTHVLLESRWHAPISSGRRFARAHRVDNGYPFLEDGMNLTTIIIILVVLAVLGGGWGYSRRGRF